MGQMKQVKQWMARWARGWHLAVVCGLVVAMVLVLTAAASLKASGAPKGPLQFLGIGVGSPGQTRSSSLADRVQSYMATMSLDAKIGQMIFGQVYFTYYDQTFSGFIKSVQPGGMIFYRPELNSTAQSNQIMQGIQHDSAIPALLGSDDEGGGIDDLDQVYPGKHPAAGAIADTLNTTYAYQQGSIMAQDVLSMGLNTDFAPVVDVPYPGSPNCDQGGYCRLWGNTPSMISTMAGSWLQGLQDGSVIGTLKHFPGLGEATIDPHKGLPVINESLQQVESLDLAPYRTLLSSDDPPGIVMSTDLIMTAIDPIVPAELSYKTITGVLRNELHYNGVVMTDALYMDGVGQYLHMSPRTDQSLAAASLMAIQAGCDFILGTFTPENTEYVINAIKDAINAGTLTVARIDQSVLRILSLKARTGLWHVPSVATPPAAQGSAIFSLDSADVRHS
jgi:beta-N-acetylhexosaminidase